MIDNYSLPDPAFLNIFLWGGVLLVVSLPIFIGFFLGALSYRFVFRKIGGSEKRLTWPSCLIAGFTTFIIAFPFFSLFYAEYKVLISYRVASYASAAPEQMESNHEPVVVELLRQYRFPPGRFTNCRSEKPDICRLAKWVESCSGSDSDFCKAAGENINLIEYNTDYRLTQAWLRYFEKIFLFGLIPCIMSVVILKSVLLRNSG